MKNQWLQIISVLVLMFSTQVNAATFPSVDFTVNNGNDIYAGDAFSIDVYARDTVELIGFGFDMRFSGSGSSNGFSVWPGQTSFLFDDVSSSLSNTDVAGLYAGLPAPFGSDPILSGDVLLATLNFIAGAEGTFNFELLSDSIGEGLSDFGFPDLIGILANRNISINAAQVPEPPVILIMLIGLLGLAKTTKLRKI